LVHFADWREMHSLNIETGAAAESFSRLENRIRGLHAELREVRSHTVGVGLSHFRRLGAIFERHPESSNAIVWEDIPGTESRNLYISARGQRKLYWENANCRSGSSRAAVKPRNWKVTIPDGR